MHRGRYQLGQHVRLGCLCRDSSRRPAAPDEAPTIDIYSDTAKVVSAKAIASLDRPAVAGLFAYPLFLGDGYAVGRYTVRYRWLIGGSEGGAVDDFEVLPGGDADGAVVAMHWFDRPHARFLVRSLDSGKIVKGRGPEVL